MIREKGVAYCGLACAVCSENETCAGCRNAGCKDRDWCKNYTCCLEKGLGGCWECDAFPCESEMLQKMRIRAFSIFIRENGEDTLLDCLERNEAAGLVYHDAGKLTGDYDIPGTEEEIISLILHGKKASAQG